MLRKESEKTKPVYWVLQLFCKSNLNLFELEAQKVFSAGKLSLTLFYKHSAWYSPQLTGDVSNLLLEIMKTGFVCNFASAKKPHYFFGPRFIRPAFTA